MFDESIPVAADKRHVKDQYPDNYFVPVEMKCKLIFLGEKLTFFRAENLNFSKKLKFSNANILKFAVNLIFSAAH